MPISSSHCNDNVFKHGVSIGFFDISKEGAEDYCKIQTEKTGRLHDWHYIGGRVHVKALPDTWVEPEESPWA